jgi:RHS repeat-associated protein
MRYKAWGEVRHASGTTPTDYTFTGQKSEMAGLGLMFYKSRWYDPCIMQFQSPDTLVPDPYNPQDLNRYSYARNNPLKYIDPSGHYVCESATECDWKTEKEKDISITWEQKLGALAVYKESGNGTFPHEAMALTAHILLNRELASWAQYEYPLWEGVSGTQTAFYLLEEEGFPLPNNFEGWSSEDELAEWVNATWDLAMNDPHRSGFVAALNATVAASNQPRGTEIYFSHQTDPVDHKTVKERHNWIIETANLRSLTDPQFSFAYYGPFWSTAQGLTILLVGSNDKACGKFGSCGPPWPPGTP